MAVVTNGLFFYWHAKDGIKTGNVLNNIAPNGVASNMTLVGGTILGDGGIALDGIDDYLQFTASGPDYQTYGTPFTMQFVFTPRVFSGDHEIYAGGIFLGTFTWGKLYWEFTHSGGTFTTGQVNTVNQLNSATPLVLTVTYNGATSAKIYANNTLLATQTLSATTAFSGWRTTHDIFRGVYQPPYKADFYGYRAYNRVLTTTEIAQNVTNGVEIGMSTPRVKIGEIRITGANIPVYDLDGHETEPLRYSTGTNVGFIPLVPIGDAKASRIRQAVGATILAWEEL